MEILKDTPPTIPIAPRGPAGAGAVNLHKTVATEQTVMREEAKSRLALMDELIGEQRSRIASARAGD